MKKGRIMGREGCKGRKQEEKGMKESRKEKGEKGIVSV